MRPRYDRRNPDSIERYANRLVSHTLREMVQPCEVGLSDRTTTSTAKGGFGNMLERLYFEIHPSNDAGVPDFDEAGVELKSTPVLKKGSRLVAKERVVLNMINYMELVDEDWDSSNFWRKNRLLLMVFYLHMKDVPVMDLEVKLAGLWRFPESDLLQIKADWKMIKDMVGEGRAHELSEGLTQYLGACTKDAYSRINRKQPRSSQLAKARAFALKQSYVNVMIERMSRAKATEALEPIVKDPIELSKISFEELVANRFEPYLGMSVAELFERFDIKASPKAKNLNDLITKRILGVNGRIEEFEKAGVVVRSIVLETSGRLTESVSFPAFDYIELAKETSWEESEIREMFDRKFFFVVYQKRPDGAKELNKVLFWSMPYKDLMEVKRVWEETIRRIKEGRTGDLPGISESEVSHIRPHGRNAQDRIRTPDGRMEVKKCFWLNAKYVALQVGASRWSGIRQSKLTVYEKDEDRL